MKIIISIFLSFIFQNIVLNAQNNLYTQVKLTLDNTLIVDSISLKTTPTVFNILKTDHFDVDQVTSPVKSLQAFITFDNREWGRSISKPEYNSLFPFPETLDIHKSDDYQKNTYVKIFFILYYKYGNKSFATLYFETYINKQYPKYTGFTTFEFYDKKWLLTDDWYLSRLRDIKILKPEFIIALIQGKTIKGNTKYNELLNLIYKDGTIDLYLFNSLGHFNKEYYNTLINK